MRRHVIYLDRTPRGELWPGPGLTLGMRIALVAAMVAVIAGGLALGAFILGLALTLVPIALVAIVVAYAAFRIELWRSHRAVRGQRDVFRRP